MQTLWRVRCRSGLFLFVIHGENDGRKICLVEPLYISMSIYEYTDNAMITLTTGWAIQDRIPVGTRFFGRPGRPWGPSSLLENGYRISPRGKVLPGRDHSPPSSAAVMEE